MIVEGDLLDQPVEVIVNAWNRNIIPWWLLLPQGVSGAIKRRAGLQPFREVARFGPIPLGGAVLTSAGRLGYRSVAFPLIGAGSGGGSPERIQEMMAEELAGIAFDGEVRLVRFSKKKQA